jgi:hypothetical protein
MTEGNSVTYLGGRAGEASGSGADAALRSQQICESIWPLERLQQRFPGMT